RIRTAQREGRVSRRRPAWYQDAPLSASVKKKPDIHRLISNAIVLTEILRDLPMMSGKQFDFRHVTISRRQLPGDGRWVGMGGEVGVRPVVGSTGRELAGGPLKKHLRPLGAL